MIRIERHLVTEMPIALKDELKSRVDREFGDVPIVREHVWAEPTWAFLGFDGGQLVSFLNIVDRFARADKVPIHLFGLNNVITEPQHRGQGFSTQLNQMALAFMTDVDPDACGFLFCADDLIPFYSGIGWKTFKGEVTVSQPSGEKRWPSNAMFYDPIGIRSWREVNLCGLPW